MAGFGALIGVGQLWTGFGGSDYCKRPKKVGGSDLVTSGEPPDLKKYRNVVFLTFWNEISWPLGNFGPPGQLQESCQIPELARKSFFIEFRKTRIQVIRQHLAF